MENKNKFKIVFVRLGADIPTGSGSEPEVTHISGEWADGRGPKPEQFTSQRAIELMRSGMLSPFVVDAEGREHPVQAVKAPDGRELLRTSDSFAERNLLLDVRRFRLLEDLWQLIGRLVKRLVSRL